MNHRLDPNVVAVENSHIWAREQHEHYVEPEWCSRRLFDVETFVGAVDDPFCGFGAIPKAAAGAGYDITSSDIVDRGYGHGGKDFFKSTWGRDNIVSNPPFDQFRQVAEHALRVAARKIALIWLVRTLPAARWLHATPLARIWLLTPGPSMPPGHVITAGEKPGGGKQDFCWLVWDRVHAGPPTIGWLRRDA